jgi:hypothetical protein
LNNRDKKIPDGGLTGEPSLKKAMSENIPRIIIVGTTALIIITSLLILVVSSDPLEKRIKDLFTSIAALASAAFISVFSYHYQNKSQYNRDQITNEINTNRDQMTREINTITKEQDRRSRSFLNGPLILISSDISKLSKILENDDDVKKIRNPSHIQDNNGQQEILQRFQNKNRQIFKEGIKNIREKSLYIRTFIGDIYEDISVSAEYFEDTINNQQRDIKSWINTYKSTIHEADIARDHIDYFLFTQFEPKDFQNVEFSTVLGQESKCIIVVGSKREYDEPTETGHLQPAKDDYELAKQINKKMKEKHGIEFTIKVDKEVSKCPELLKNNHLILLGGTRINKLARDIIGSFPLQYVRSENSDNIYSRISQNIFGGHGYGILQAIKSPFANDKIIVSAFGPELEGTEVTVKILYGKIDSSISEEKMKNKYDKNYHAKVIKIVTKEELEKNKNDASYIKIVCEGDESKTSYIHFEE